MTLEQVHQVIRQLIQQNRLGEAENLCRQVLSQKPDEPGTNELLGLIVNQLGVNAAISGDPIAAEKKFLEALRLRPSDPSIHNNIGGVLLQQHRAADALDPLIKAVELKPDYADAWQNLGLAHFELHDPQAAHRAWSRVNTLAATLMRAGAYRSYGRLDEAIECYREILSRQPQFSPAFSDILYTTNLHDRFTPAEIFAEHREFSRRFEKPRDRPQRKNHGGKIRVGFVSQDFQQHATGRFLPAAMNLDKEKFEIACYASVATPDAATRNYRTLADHWTDISRLSDSDAARKIERDQIDVLVDLSGHTSGNRLMIFTHRPAPLQITWLGYPNTTGLSCMDWRITDSLADPAGMTEHLHSEKLLRLDPCFLCYVPDANDPPVRPREGKITFASFNDFSKIRPTTIRLWASVLREVPGSRMLLKCKQLAAESARADIVAAFEQEGISPDRLTLLGRDASRTAHLDRFNEIDIALDTYPYHGTTTTCETLWMGVPVVSLIGKTHVSRVGKSLLHNVGLPELAADDEADFVRIAAQLAGDRDRLRSIRSTLRDRMAAGSLCDAQNFAARFEAMIAGLMKI